MKEPTTPKGGVLTTRGFIPYLRHEAGFDMPVMVRPDIVNINNNPRPPMIKDGYLVFALPGGGIYLSLIESPRGRGVSIKDVVKSIEGKNNEF